MASNKISIKDSNEWKHLPTVNQRIRHLYNNELMSDVMLRFGKNQKLMAHKLILSSGSQVFYQLFNEPINKTINYENNKQIIEINHCDFNAFKSMVRYLYSDHIDINDNNVLQLIQCSKSYQINSLVNSCLEFIVEKLNENNCLKWWQQLRRHLRSAPETKLIEKCAQIIATNASNVLRRHEIINLSIDELIELFSRNDLNISEYELFETSIRWAYQECIRKEVSCDDHNLRACLGMGFDLIRFPLMSSEELGKIVAQNSDLFCLKELAALISYTTGNSKLMTNHSLPFSKSPRIPICGDSIRGDRCECLPTQLSPNSRFNNQYYCFNQSYSFSPQQQPIGLAPLPRCQTYSLVPAMSPCIGVLNGVQNQNKCQNIRTAVITDPITGQILNLEELASSLVREPLRRANINAAINSSNEDMASEFEAKVAKVSAQPLINDSLLHFEDEEEVDDKSLIEEQTIEVTHCEDSVDHSLSIDFPFQTRIQYSREFLLSLKNTVLSQKMRLQLLQIYDHFQDIFID